ncbi:alpha/beta hydrolase family protein [Taibaiella soli]|uniref:Alpha/beta hydrolase n=1 Tax=Taibaiella soli TaxID=1649169 RepID=A0A2W2ABA0_9BACT|nr:hypothetical protein [Taibaiella soli]PZF70882.1 hypothetical protein DN068_20875 [Taibaiella soli]
MRYLLSLILLIAFLTNTNAQSPYEYFNNEDFWKNMIMESSEQPLPALAASDTVIVIASSRNIQPGDVRFVGELRDGKTLRYYLMYARAGKWYIHPYASIVNAIRAVPDINRDWVTYTEGMGKIFTSDADRGMQMSGQYGVNVLLLDYPSIRTTYKPLKNYKFALRNACICYKDFMPVLDTVKMLRDQHKMGTGHLSLFFHSMGNNMIREIAKHDAVIRYNQSVWVDNIILNAPCVPRKKHAKWVDKIHFGEHIYVHYNPEDGTLKWARIAGFRQIMGEHMKKPLSQQAIYINFEPLCGTEHSNFLNLYSRKPIKEAAYAHYRLLFHGETVDVHNRMLYAPSEYRRIGFQLMR